MLVAPDTRGGGELPFSSRESPAELSSAVVSLAGAGRISLCLENQELLLSLVVSIVCELLRASCFSGGGPRLRELLSRFSPREVMLLLGL